LHPGENTLILSDGGFRGVGNSGLGQIKIAISSTPSKRFDEPRMYGYWGPRKLNLHLPVSEIILQISTGIAMLMPLDNQGLYANNCAAEH
jgi:hypothetical protein